jgi:hypothetical protein
MNYLIIGSILLIIAITVVIIFYFGGNNVQQIKGTWKDPNNPMFYTIEKNGKITMISNYDGNLQKEDFGIFKKGKIVNGIQVYIKGPQNLPYELRDVGTGLFLVLGKIRMNQISKDIMTNEQIKAYKP